MLRVAALNSVGTFVLFLGKLTVVIATVVCGVQIMNVSVTAQRNIKSTLIMLQFNFTNSTKIFINAVYFDQI